MTAAGRFNWYLMKVVEVDPNVMVEFEQGVAESAMIVERSR